MSAQKRPLILLLAGLASIAAGAAAGDDRTLVVSKVRQ